MKGNQHCHYRGVKKVDCYIDKLILKSEGAIYFFFFCFPKVSQRGGVTESSQWRGFPLDLCLLVIWGFWFF